MTSLLAQVEIHERTNSCVSDNGFCPDWIVHNLDRYTHPLVQHIVLTVVSVGIGFAIAFALAILAYRRRSLIGPVTNVTGILYTLPSVAVFFLLLPITGFGFWTAVIPLSAYTLQIIYRNAVAGLANVPEDAKDAGRGMGMSDGELLLKVELPLATPEIVAGLRIAIVSTVAIATLAFLAGAGGLGQLLSEQNSFKTNIILVGVLTVVMALVLDLIALCAQRFLTPWLRVRSS
jgi:osmoprotectant transport system permease protein